MYVTLTLAATEYGKTRCLYMSRYGSQETHNNERLTFCMSL